jgi:hypothetical protein
MPNHGLNDTHIPSQAVFLDSNDATISISDSEKVFYLNSPIIAPAGIRILIGLTNLTIANTIFNVDSRSSNNKLSLTQSGTTEVITIDSGNYSASTLVEALNASITLDITVSFDENNANFIFTGGSNFTINSETTMSRQLGLKNQLPTSAATSYVALHVCDFAGATNIYVRLRNVSMSNLDSRGRTTNVIASIVNSANFSDFIFYVPPEVLYFQINEQQLAHIDLELTDQEGQVIQLNGSSFNLTLSVHFSIERQTNVFDNRVLSEIHQREIKTEELKTDSN